jgi:hypothetical protein
MLPTAEKVMVSIECKRGFGLPKDKDEHHDKAK